MKRWVRRNDVVARRVAGETVLVPVGIRRPGEQRVADLYVLNATAERLWQWLAEPAAETDLARNLMAEYEVNAEMARTDVSAFLASLAAIDAVHPVESA